jgi:hypothetical protein
MIRSLRTGPPMALFAAHSSLGPRHLPWRLPLSLHRWGRRAKAVRWQRLAQLDPAEEAVRRVPGIKVLFTTGHTPNATVHNGVVDPGVELIPKPFTLEQLARKVHCVLDSE